MDETKFCSLLVKRASNYEWEFCKPKPISLLSFEQGKICDNRAKNYWFTGSSKMKCDLLTFGRANFVIGHLSWSEIHQVGNNAQKNPWRWIKHFSKRGCCTCAKRIVFKKSYYTIRYLKLTEFHVIIQAVTCAPLNTPPRALLLTVSCGSTYASTCVYGCQSGYGSTDPNATRTCLQTGRWSGKPINCTGIKCIGAFSLLHAILRRRWV